jgi:hypothetical protein
MRGLKGGSAYQSNYVNGLRIQNSLYNQVIPVIYGRDRVRGLLIFRGNFQTHSSGGVSGTSGASGSQQTYTINADLLLGFGPVEFISAVWANNQLLYIDAFTQTFTGVGGPSNTWTFTINNVPGGAPFGGVFGVTLSVPYSNTYTDYGNPAGSQTQSGTAQMPLYNSHVPFPNSGNIANSAIPYATFNTSAGDMVVTVHFPTAVSAPTITAYYWYDAGSGPVPIQAAGLVFEQELGTGPEYSYAGAPAAIIYTELSGAGGQNIMLGGVNVLPQFNFTAQGLYAHGPLGLCNPADLIADIICSGNHTYFTGNPLTAQNGYIAMWNHGLNFTSVIVPGAGSGFQVTNYFYSRFGGILKDEPNLWGSGLSGGTNLGLNALRNYCEAFGISISGTLDSQRKAAQWITELCEIGNCAPVWDGAGLDFIPYCEQSQAGNGFSFVAPTSAGPVFALAEQHFVCDKGKPPITVQRARQKQLYNTLTVEFTDISSASIGPWQQNSITVNDTLDMIVQGPVTGGQKSFPWIHDPTTATMVAWALLRRNLISGRKTYKFTLQPSLSWLAPMDLVTLNDPALSPTPVPVRFTKMTEKADFSIECEAEPFIFGASLPQQVVTQSASGGGGQTGIDPGSVNTPIIFEAVPGLASQPEIWIIASGATAPNAYGGCVVWVSADGGSTYVPVANLLAFGQIGDGTFYGEGVQGLTYSATYPSHVDPDTVDNLFVDLTQSTGVLPAFSSTLQNQFASLCYLAGGGTIVVNGQTLTVPYELIAYGGATVTSGYQETLAPPIRRGVYGTPIVSHAVGTPFAYIGSIRLQSDSAVPMKIALPQQWIGVTLYFKFTAFNIFGSNQQALSAATAYPFTPSGLVGWSYSSPSVVVGNQSYPSGGINPSNQPPYILTYFEGDGATPLSSQKLLRMKVPADVASISLPVTLAGSAGGCISAPTSAWSAALLQNGVSIGSLNIAAGATTMTFTFTVAVTLNPGDLFDIIAPATVDPTIAGVYVSIAGTRN